MLSRDTQTRPTSVPQQVASGLRGTSPRDAAYLSQLSAPTLELAAWSPVIVDMIGVGQRSPPDCGPSRTHDPGLAAHATADRQLARRPQPLRDVARRAGAAEARHLAAHVPARTAAECLSCHHIGRGRHHRGHGFGHVAAGFLAGLGRGGQAAVPVGSVPPPICSAASSPRWPGGSEATINGKSTMQYT
jgi:hypothetical protein